MVVTDVNCGPVTVMVPVNEQGMSTAPTEAGSASVPTVISVQVMLIVDELSDMADIPAFSKFNEMSPAISVPSAASMVMLEISYLEYCPFESSMFRSIPEVTGYISRLAASPDMDASFEQ